MFNENQTSMKKIFMKLSFAAILLAMVSFSLKMYATGPGLFSNTGGPVPNTSVGMSQLYSVTGHYTLSADGIGKAGSDMTIRVNKPSATATVQKAYFFSALTIATLSPGCITLASTPVTWDGIVPYQYFTNYYADVTTIVAPIVNPLGAGISTLPVTECSLSVYQPDGEALLVVFNDAGATDKTIIIMFGGLSTTGDSYSVTLGTPIDPNAPGAVLDMGLGIGFSFQSAEGYGEQYSTVDVNGSRLTSSAGGADDAVDTPFNGNLITVGGIGDVNTNPADPNGFTYNQRQDDELYSLLPFITNTTTNITVNTTNPSNNDNVFLSYFVVSGSAIIGQGIVLSQISTSGPVNVSHSVFAHVVNGQGAPLPGRSTTFTVLSGPNAGILGTAVTDINGLATMSYTGSVVGTDVIRACMSSPANSLQVCSNEISYDWTIVTNVPTMSQWGLILLAVALLGVGTAYILRKKSTDVAI